MRGLLTAPPTAALVLAALSAPAFQDGPPVRSTGGFGEDTCQGCHFTGVLDDPPGRIDLTGLPERFVPGATYTLVVTLAHPELATAGFQLTVRDAADGAQAGALEIPDGEHGRVGTTEARGVTFAHHALDGTRPGAAGRGRWSVSWTAPKSAASVVVHAAAVVGDGDASQAGDRVYALTKAAEPAVTSEAGCCVRSSCAENPSGRPEYDRC